jgi:hypothetical protein
MIRYYGSLNEGQRSKAKNLKIAIDGVPGIEGSISGYDLAAALPSRTDGGQTTACARA